MKNYDIAAYVWPSFTGREKRAWQFWPDKIGEWQTVKEARQNYEGEEWPRKPLWGYVDEADPKVMEMQIKEAVSHGVNVFIYDWYWYDGRPFLENCLNDGFLKAANNHLMKFYIMWANHNATSVWDKRISNEHDIEIWKGEVDRKNFEIIVDRIINNYFVKENYYKINGKPVFSIYDINNFVNGLGGMEQAAAALEYFNEKARQAGFPGVHLQMVLWNEKMLNLSGVDGGKNYTVPQVINSLRFDSITHYQFVHFADMNRDYNVILSDAAKERERIAESYTLPYYPHISVGWDNNPRFKIAVKCNTKNNTPENFKKGLMQVKEFSDKHNPKVPLITVNSWNEWTETSYLQPDDMYGYGYLDAIKEVFLK